MADRAPTAAELEQMKDYVRHGMEAGAFGLSSGLYYAPGSYSQTEEVIALAKVAAAYSGVYQSHIRDEARWQGFAYADQGAVREGRWKLVRMPPPFGVDRWRLYRLDHDPSELFDLAGKETERVEHLTSLFERYARRNGVVLPALATQKPTPSDR